MFGKITHCHQFHAVEVESSGAQCHFGIVVRVNTLQGIEILESMAMASVSSCNPEVRLKPNSMVPKSSPFPASAFGSEGRMIHSISP